MFFIGICLETLAAGAYSDSTKKKVFLDEKWWVKDNYKSLVRTSSIELVVHSLIALKIW